MAAEMSRESRAMLLNVLWHHQGGSSPVGQPLRKLLGIGQHDYLTVEQLSEAKWIDKLLADAVHKTPAGVQGRVVAWMRPGLVEPISDRLKQANPEFYEHHTIPLVLATSGVPASDVGYTEDDLIKALAECRDAFPIPAPGAPSEQEWMQAIGDPLHVPVFVKAALAAHGVKGPDHG